MAHQRWIIRPCNPPRDRREDDGQDQAGKPMVRPKPKLGLGDALAYDAEPTKPTEAPAERYFNVEQ